MKAEIKKRMTMLALAGLLVGCAYSDRGSAGAQSGGTTSGTGSGSFPNGRPEAGVIRSDGTNPSGDSTVVEIPSRTNRVDF